MFRLAFFLPLTPLLATPCLAQQFPVVPDGELPIAAIELEKMPWTRVLGVGPIEFATIVGDRARPGLYIPAGPLARLTRSLRPIRIPMTGT
jgi:hypothetical protein